MQTPGVMITASLAVLVGGMATLWYIDYTANPGSTFASYAEIERSGLMAAGWLPQYLPPSATDIEERHNLDTNGVWARFRYEAGDLESVESNCNRIAGNDRGKKFLCPPFDARTSTIVLRNDGTGDFISYENGI
jgi:hypothetical protein